MLKLEADRLALIQDVIKMFGLPGAYMAEETPAKKAEEAVQQGDPTKTPVCQNHVAGPYWGAPCPNCGGPVTAGDAKNEYPMKRNA